MRTKLLISPTQKEDFGFVMKGAGDDPRDFWHELKLETAGIILSVDAYSDYSISIPESNIDDIQVSIQSIEDLEAMRRIFDSPTEGSFEWNVQTNKKLEE